MVVGAWTVGWRETAPDRGGREGGQREGGQAPGKHQDVVLREMLVPQVYVSGGRGIGKVTGGREGGREGWTEGERKGGKLVVRSQRNPHRIRKDNKTCSTSRRIPSHPPPPPTPPSHAHTLCMYIYLPLSIYIHIYPLSFATPRQKNPPPPFSISLNHPPHKEFHIPYL
jgi:hypothetical protein